MAQELRGLAARPESHCWHPRQAAPTSKGSDAFWPQWTLAHM